MNKEERDKFIGKILAIIICIIMFGGPIVFLIHDIYVRHKPVPQETINQYEAVGFKVDKIINPEKCKYVILRFGKIIARFRQISEQLHNLGYRQRSPAYTWRSVHPDHIRNNSENQRNTSYQSLARGGIPLDW